MNALSVSPVVFVLLIFLIYFYPTEALEFKYHDNKELENVMKNFSATTKNIYTKLHSIGRSVRGEPLWVMEMSGSRKYMPDIPNIKFVGNIHGNEAVGRELLLHFMEYLRDNYPTNPSVKCLLDNSRIHLLPSMNPDGFATAGEGFCKGVLGRENGNDEDLNRNFPDFFHQNLISRQPETEAVIRWMNKTPFSLSAGLHGGMMVANYPFDTEEKPNSSNDNKASVTPDDDVFKYLATTYASNHPTMKNSLCENGETKQNFVNGITNGAQWYSFDGGMQDYNYLKGSMEITLEISCCKYPRHEELEKLWKQNQKSLLMYSMKALEGLSGQVIDGSNEQPIANASLQIIGRSTNFSSSPTGHFWRILLPGKYVLKVEAPGYHSALTDFEILDQTDKVCPKKTTLRIQLTNDKLPLPHALQQPLPSTVNTQESSEARIINNGVLSIQSAFLIPPEEEKIVFNSIFGRPEDFNKSITERDIRRFMMSTMNITDMTNFDGLLKKFDEKDPTEKTKVLQEVGKIFKAVLYTYTSEKKVREYIKEKLQIKDFKPYEGVLKDFDEKSAKEKEKALDDLLKIYLQQKSTNNGCAMKSDTSILGNLLLFSLLFIKWG